jgi:uncharacterized protein (TIGR03435 family)
VFDRTGIQGEYQFDIDWLEQMQGQLGNDGLPAALAGVKRLGLQLEPGKESRKVLVLDQINKHPTEN